MVKYKVNKYYRAHWTPVSRCRIYVASEEQALKEV